MMRRILTTVAVSCLCLLAVTLPARAQGVGHQLAFNVKFDFMAGDKVVQAGEYVIDGSSKGTNDLRLQRTDGKFQLNLTPITRLARQHQGDAPKGSLVFDKIGEQHVLSEVWLPGQDGYLLRGGREEHQHEVVDVK